MSQLSILSEIDRVTQAAINQAEDHANEVHEDWSQTAYAYFITFVAHQPPGIPFSVEEIRQAGAYIVPDPPTNRAWGAIARKAVADNLIKHHGYGQSSQKNCHKGIVRLWVK